jgi:hypothetical protein
MIMEIKRVITSYTRNSKLGVEHKYTRNKTVIVIECDNCKNLFERDLGKMDRKRLNNNYFYVCANCDSKKFAQKVGAKSRRFWNISVDTDIDITQY